jgi:hypothetical protein
MMSDLINIYEAEHDRVENGVRTKILSDSYRWHRMFINDMHRSFGLVEKPKPIIVRFNNPDMLDDVIAVHANAVYKRAGEGWSTPQIVLQHYSLIDSGWMNMMMRGYDNKDSWLEAMSSLREAMPTAREFESEIRSRRFDTMHETGHYLHDLSNPEVLSLPKNDNNLWARVITEIVPELAALVHAHKFGFIGRSTAESGGEADLEGAHRIFRANSIEESRRILEGLVQCRTMDEAMQIDAFKTQYEANFEAVRKHVAQRETAHDHFCADPALRYESATDEEIQEEIKRKREQNRLNGARR